ncbi:MAG: DNA repair protein RecN [Chitinophagaceae bacterium]|nr:MAG: DNA repair protein RecN [Chitinophagaceae bacterium]
MLERLYISNYAIIDELELLPAQGLNIITGETGAGKSILLGALDLILGERADTSVLVNKEKKTIIEASFLSENKKDIQQFLSENELDENNEIIIRREINPNGKSRSFINDTPVSLAQLQNLSSFLVDMHQQFDTMQLNDSLYQINIIDALAKNENLLTEFKALFQTYQKTEKELAHLLTQKADFEKEKDYNQFLFDELNDLGLVENELEDIDIQLKALNSAEEIKSALNKAEFILSESEEPVLYQLKNITQQLNSYTSYNLALKDIVDRLNSAQIEIQDIAREISSISQNIHYDETAIDQLNARLSIGYKLQKKHGLHSTNELITLKNQLAEKLENILSIDDAIEQHQQQVDSLQKKAQDIAHQITKSRKKIVPSFEKDVNHLLAQVGMPNAAIQVAISSVPLCNSGFDSVEILFDANKSGQFKPIKKVASGGELGRLMLCIKSLVATSMDMPTLIFDEIDTGISGEAAKQVGLIMKNLAGSRQVICITHQPQIAGKADAHYYVYKEEKSGKIRTDIKQLSVEERIHSIAQMLSGATPTIAALENAKEMILHK